MLQALVLLALVLILTSPPSTSPFNSFQPISRPITIGSFVGYRRRTNYSTNEYLIAQVENIVDFSTQYKVKLLKRTQYYLNSYSGVFYTLDENESHEFTTKINLVLLNPPERDDTQFVHKYYFPSNIQQEIETFFNENCSLYSFKIVHYNT